MEAAKQKGSDMASSAKAHVKIHKAKAEEKTEKAMATTEEEKEIAHQLRKAKEHEAKVELHVEKAEHEAEKLEAKQAHHHHEGGLGIGRHYQTPVVGYNDPATGSGVVTTKPLGSSTTAPVPGVTAPKHPLGGHLPHPGPKYTY